MHRRFHAGGICIQAMNIFAGLHKNCLAKKSFYNIVKAELRFESLEKLLIYAVFLFLLTMQRSFVMEVWIF